MSNSRVEGSSKQPVQASASARTPKAVYKSIITYDGTDFQGFQRQAEGLRTVQGVVESALRSVSWQGQSLIAAGRTDAGVHARGQVIAYEMAWRHEADRLTRALNANLPSDVAILLTEIAQRGFHPRFSAKRRRYHYALIASSVPDPLRERYAWRVWPEPNLEVMEAIAAAIVGRRDFAPFGRPPIPGGHSVRQVFSAEWRSEFENLVFEIEADAFLYHMVRRLVAAMLDVGNARLGVQDFQAVLDDPERRWEGQIAPARGLFLEEVIYDE
jgi:tRNA pseudouridine38-40 synthase